MSGIRGRCDRCDESFDCTIDDKEMEKYFKYGSSVVDEVFVDLTDNQRYLIKDVYFCERCHKEYIREKKGEK